MYSTFRVRQSKNFGKSNEEQFFTEIYQNIHLYILYVFSYVETILKCPYWNVKFERIDCFFQDFKTTPFIFDYMGWLSQ